ncbi:MAG: AmmeMemoRadiSam system radical SAM enzyme [Anaerolineae bacterium]|nr:AmmeMemoRadiSam system radical SAM enzyme [Anaerolineae bacterium]
MQRSYPHSILDELTTEGQFYEKIEGDTIRCFACALRCRIQPGRRGICQVRFNQGGKLRVPWGYVAGLQIDPVEKKPFTHFLPGSKALTFGMLGCNFRCSFCQNWMSSQTLRDPAAGAGINGIQKIKPEQLVNYAHNGGATILAASYNEPLITSEWAMSIFELAKAAGLYCAYVSNGHATPQVITALRPYLTALKIDLKSMQEKNYRSMGGHLSFVLDTIQLAQQLGIWVEIVTLVIPGFNDTSDELWQIGRFLASVSTDIPWHVTAYHPDYNMHNPPTPAATLQMAAEIGQEAGLRYVYAGNLPGKVGSLEDTVCPHCQSRLIRRRGYRILDYRLTASGLCPDCNQPIAGIWSSDPQSVKMNNEETPRRMFW